MTTFDSIHTMISTAEEKNLPLWELILDTDCRLQNITRDQSLAKMGGMLDAMRQVGEMLPSALKETAKGGLAVTPFGINYAPKEGN